MQYKDDPVIMTANGYAIPRVSWALVRNGVITAIAHTYNADKAPFGDVPVAAPGAVPLDGDVAMRIAPETAAVGHLVDEKGNTTPAEGRTRSLLPGERAYSGPRPDQMIPVAAPDDGPEAKPEGDPEEPEE